MKAILIERLAFVDPYRTRLTSWWVGLSERERRLVSLLAGLIVLAILIVGVARPLQTGRAAALADIRTYETLNARLRAAGPVLGQVAPTRDGPVSAVVTGSASQFGLTVQRIEPEGEGVRVEMAGVPYDNLLRWLADLERTSRVRVAEIELDRQPTPGMVTARMLLAE